MDRLYKEAVLNAGSHSAVLSSPADVFAVCAKVAKATGCYLTYSTKTKKNIVPSAQCKADGEAWLTSLQSANHMQLGADFLGSVPFRVIDSWDMVSEWIRFAAQTPLNAERKPVPQKVISSVLYLIAASDEACGGIGLPDGGDTGFFGLVSNWRLIRRGTLCRFLDSNVVRVLPKQHTPKFGLNIRNLTHHLAFIENSEVGVRWNINPILDKKRASFNILLVPWPFEVLPSDIRASVRESGTSNMGYFDYVPKADVDVIASVSSLIERAQSMGQRVDLVVLPECSINESQWKALSKVLLLKKVSLLAGVAGRGAQGVATNSVKLKVPGNPGDLLSQNKHHRWKIEKNQIQSYGLGGTLSCQSEWWENIEIKPREVNFFAFTDDLVVCPLICEDLARQDPVADVVRSVGPNMVIALLMDGPQLSNRWSARYASVLADDPGSSVLTLSSLGMVNISRPPRGADRRQVIASWREAQGGFVEIDLPPGTHGALLNVQFVRETEQTVDGRGDSGVASCPTLTGIHYV